MYPEICYSAFFPFAYRRSFEKDLFRLEFWLLWRSPTARIDYLDFLEIEAIFRKTNYITFSYLLIGTSGQTVSKKHFYDCGREILILLGIYRHLLLTFMCHVIALFWFAWLIMRSHKTDDTRYMYVIQALVEFGESRKIIPVAGLTLSNAFPAMKQAFSLDN